MNIYIYIYVCVHFYAVCINLSHRDDRAVRSVVLVQVPNRCEVELAARPQLVHFIARRFAYFNLVWFVVLGLFSYSIPSSCDDAFQGNLLSLLQRPRATEGHRRNYCCWWVCSTEGLVDSITVNRPSEFWDVRRESAQILFHEANLGLYRALGTIHIRSQCLLARCQACRLAPHDMVGCTKYSKAGSPWASMHFQPFCTHSGLVTQPLRERER